jgi:hypothetical protein
MRRVLRMVLLSLRSLALLLALLLGLTPLAWKAIAEPGRMAANPAPLQPAAPPAEPKPVPVPDVLTPEPVTDPVVVPMDVTQGKKPAEPTPGAQPRSLTRAEMEQLMQEGYSGADILAAGELVQTFGSDPHTVLKKRKDGDEWAKIRGAEQQRWNEQKVAEWQANPDIRLGEDGTLTQTASGLTVGEIKALVKSGHKLEEIMRADAQARAFELDFRQIVRSKAPGQSLRDAVHEAHMKRTPEVRDAVQKRNLKKQQAAPANRQGEGVAP